MTHPAAFQVSFSSAIGIWRPRSLVVWRHRSPLPSHLHTCTCNFGHEIAPSSEELQSRTELSPKELHHLRKKKERKVLRKRKKELLEKKRLEELAKLPVVKPNYAMRRFDNSNTFEAWNKPRKKRPAGSVGRDSGFEASSKQVEAGSEESNRLVSSWSEFEAVYRDRLKSLIGGNDLASGEDVILEKGSGYDETCKSESYLGRLGATGNLCETVNGINSGTSEAIRNVGGIDESETGGALLEQRDSRQFLQEQIRDRMESVGSASYRGNIAKVIVGQRNGTPVYLSTEDDDSRDMRKIRRDDLNEQKQLDWLAKQLIHLNLRTDGVHFSRLMRSAGLKITDGRAVVLLQLLGMRGKWRCAMRVVEWLSTRHQYPPMKSRYVYTTLLAVLGQTRRPTEALSVFKSMCEDIDTYPDMAAYHSIAVTLGQAGCLEELLDLVPALRRGPKNMKYSLKLENHGVLDPDLVVFNAVLNACVSHKDWRCALWVLSEIRKAKLQPNSASYGLAIEVMVKAGKLNLAFETLEEMETDSCHPNSLTYKVLVEGLGLAGKPDAAVALVKRMEQRGIVPTSGVYFALASTLCTSGRWKEAILQVGRLMEVSDKPLVETYTGLITACDKAGHWQDAISVFKFMQEVCAPNIGTYNVMIALYGRHKLFPEAKFLFDRLKGGRLTSTKMDKNGCRLTPDSFTYDAMLGACAVCGEWESLETTYEQMLLQGYELKPERHAWILEALGKAWKHGLVEFMFSRVLSQNETVTSELYQIMICSFIAAGRDKEAFSCLEEMVKRATNISTKQLRKLQEASCSLSDAERQKFLDLLDRLEVSSVFAFERSGKPVTSGDQSWTESRTVYRGLRTSMITYEQRGRTSHRKEETVQVDLGASPLMRMGSSLGRRQIEEEESAKDIGSLEFASRGGKRRKPKKPECRPDPEIPGWELLWTSLDQEHQNQLDMSLFQ